MKTRTLSRNLLAAALFAAIPLSAAAISTGPALTAAQTKALTNLKTRGAAEIDRRVTNLTAANAKLASSAKLTPADKTALSGQVNDELTALTQLRAKLTADTDLATARTDVQSIVTDYRVYVLMLPKARLVAAVDRLIVTQGDLTSLSARLKTKIDAAKAAGKDTTAMQASLTDLDAKVAASKAITDGMVASLLAIKPADYNANHAALTTYRQSLGTAQSDLKGARADVASIVNTLQAGK